MLGVKDPEGKDLVSQGQLFSQVHMCCSNVETSKVKSGKYAKSHVNLKCQELWPHMHVLRKYTKRVSFDNLDFESFVAGETRIIYTMDDQAQAMGRLRLLCRLAHWTCKCRDWPLIRGLYEAVIESVELGEEDWTSDFSHYETMIPPGPSAQQARLEIRDSKVKEKDRTWEVFWCKGFQHNQCTEKAPHMSVLKPDEPPVPVVHECAYCLQKEHHRMEHQECECLAKR